MECEALVNILQGLLLLGIGLAAVYLGKGLIGLAYAYLSTSILIFIFSFFVTIKKFAKPKLEINLDFWKFLIKNAIPIGLMAIFSTIYLNTDTVMLSLMKGDTAVGWYNAGYKLMNVLKFISAMFVLAIFPVMSDFYITSIESLKRFFKKSMQYMFMLGLPIGLGITILSYKIIPIIFGQQFSPAISVLQILIWVSIFDFLAIIISYCLIAINKQQLSTYMCGAGMVINIILNLILIPRFSYIGASIAIVSSEFMILTLGFLFIHQNLRINLLPPKTFEIILSSLLMGGSIWLVRDLSVILIIPSSAVFYFAILIVLKGVTRTDLKLIRHII